MRPSDLSDLFRLLLPRQNPIGFGASDLVELIIAALLVALVLTCRPWIEPYARKLAEKTGWSMLILFLLPIVLRLALMPTYPVPSPSVSDDFSYILSADTVRHFRLANPTHPFHQFFETFFVLQEPVYSSIFPLGQGIAIALGWVTFGHPWAGVAISVGAFCALCYWMLRAWTTPGWALIGGTLAVSQFGPLNQWMNSYWGGAISAIAGCLVFGSLPRLRDGGRRRDAALLGAGLGLHLLTRPYESVFLLASALLFFLPLLRDRAGLRKVLKAAGIVVLSTLPAVALMLFQNHAVTGNWTTLPYMLSRYQYGVPATLTLQPNPIPHRELTREQQLNYEIQSGVHGQDTDSWSSYWARFWNRLRYHRFFLLAPLYLALPFFVVAMREYRFAWVAGSILLFNLGSSFYSYFYTHYIAALTCLFVLVAVAGLERLARFNSMAARMVLFLCAAHFLFWYGLHLSPDEGLRTAMTQYETWDTINHGDPEGRIAINARLGQLPGKHLVFVRYWPQHDFEEWVHNAADIDSARVVWARDLGTAENQKLQRYYPDRHVWLLEPDFRPPRLAPYQ